MSINLRDVLQKNHSFGRRCICQIVTSCYVVSRRRYVSNFFGHPFHDSLLLVRQFSKVGVSMNRVGSKLSAVCSFAFVLAFAAFANSGCSSSSTNELAQASGNAESESSTGSAVGLKFATQEAAAVTENSCAARGCHGAMVPAPISKEQPRSTRCEFTFWIRYDRHARAYDALNSELGQQIAANLNGKEGTPATKDQRCLACHSTPLTLSGDPKQPVEHWSMQGVTCIGCHGLDKQWVYEHYRWDFSDLSKLPAMYAEHNMVWMAEPTTRAEVCAGCHVGSPATEEWPVARNVTHDLIAAGHPRLQFDLKRFTEALPPHWRERNDVLTDDLLVWSVGQWKSAEASLELLVERTKANDEKGGQAAGSWPEFAEQACFDCHHTISANPGRSNWRQWTKSHFQVPEWGNPYVAMLPAISTLAGLNPETQQREIAAIQDRIDKLSELMKGFGPDEKLVRTEAQELLSLMKPLNAKFNTVPGEQQIQNYHAQLAAFANPERLQGLSWHEAAQYYMAMEIAFQNANVPKEEYEPKLASFRKVLAFPSSEVSSPRDYRTTDEDIQFFEDQLPGIPKLLKQ